MKAFFSTKYSVSIGDHTFPTQKFAKVAEAFVKTGRFQWVEPAMPPREDILMIHTPEWTKKILDGRPTLEEETLMELPWSPEVAQGHALSVSGTYLAAREALETGIGIHVGGGAHHAFPDHGEGFCIFNDLACALAKLQDEGLIRAAAVVDLDVHQGNGTVECLRSRESLRTFSIHQRDIYPEKKIPGTFDLELPRWTNDSKYLAALKSSLPGFLDLYRPNLVLYQAGVDGYKEDMLGGWALTAQGLLSRDRFVFDECLRRRIPVAVTLGGGYAERVEDTIALHVQTIEAASSAAACRA